MLRPGILACSLWFSSCASPAPAGNAGTPQASAAQPASTDLADRARRVTIIRDNWGIPHIYAKTDADVVFGLMYAQSEDDFNRVETNLLEALGRLAEAEGEQEIFRDLRMKLFVDPERLRALYGGCEPWLRKLLVAWADGLNYFLETHPEVKPRVLTHFEPWMALSFTEGSIGGDIERADLGELARLHGDESEPTLEEAAPDRDREPRGSNGIAIAPSRSTTGNPLLLINPHTSFYFRTEAHMVSEEGLNAYGAVTWGQFFIYQGFNENAGWMHTSTRADAMDWYLETVVNENGILHYRYGDEVRPLDRKVIRVPYRDGDGLKERVFTTYRSHHGPIVAARDGKWVAFRIMEEPVKALTQSYLRTRAQDHAEFQKTMDLRTNSSNNTVYADSSGNIAYWHGNFIPVRDPAYDWNEALDGSDPGTDWKGLHETGDLITLRNPPGGWIQNTNNWPFSAAGNDSPKREDYPTYMAPGRENARGLHAIRLLESIDKITLEELHALAYDPYLIAFEKLIPALLKARGPMRGQLTRQLELLEAWSLESSTESTATSLAIYWAREMWNAHDHEAGDGGNGGTSVLEDVLSDTSGREKLRALAAASARLERDFGSFEVPWGEINRFQRLHGEIEPTFDDEEPSFPVGFASARWGSLASFGARTYPNTKRMYGTSGNSFVAVVEFGKKVRARAVLSGGISRDPQSPHFLDQAQLYTRGELRPVHFYREDVEANARRTYHPGE